MTSEEGILGLSVLEFSRFSLLSPPFFTNVRMTTLDKPHRKLEVWQRSITLTTKIYTLTGRFPPEERYGLSSQMRRAAVSIPSNLAEGAARETKEFARFILIAIGSVSELDTQLEIARRLGYVSTPLYQSLDNEITQIDRMLIALRKAILKRL